MMNSSHLLDINQRFNIVHASPSGTMSFTIDNEKDILYWYNSKVQKNTYTSLIALDIKDVQNIELIKQFRIANINNESIKNPFASMFVNDVNCCTILSVGNTVQFVLGKPPGSTHFELITDINIDNDSDSQDTYKNDNDKFIDGDKKNVDCELNLIHKQIGSSCVVHSCYSIKNL